MEAARFSYYYKEKVNWLKILIRSSEFTVHRFRLRFHDFEPGRTDQTVGFPFLVDFLTVEAPPFLARPTAGFEGAAGSNSGSSDSPPVAQILENLNQSAPLALSTLSPPT